MIRILLRYRRAHLVLTALVVCSVLGLLQSGRVVDIDLHPNELPIKLPMVEACGIVCAVLAVIALRPRLWEWERPTGGLRTAVPAAAAALGGIATAPLVVTISTATLELHPSVVKYDVTTVGELLTFSALNATFVAALVFTLAPLLGPAFAGATGLLVWLGTAVLNNLVPASRDYTPISGFRLPYPEYWPHYPLAAVLVLTALAVTVHARTRGSTAFAQRLTG